MHRALIAACLLLLAGCAPQAVPSAVVPASASAVPPVTAAVTDPLPASPTDTLTPTLPAAATQPPTLPATMPVAATTTSAPVIDTPLTPQPGLTMQGYVRLADGSGVPGVRICRSFASYAGTVVATTDANGYFQSGFAFIPGDEMVGVWAVAEGYTFQPDYYRWRHYYGVEDRGLDFVAATGTAAAAPQFPCQ